MKLTPGQIKALIMLHNASATGTTSLVLPQLPEWWEKHTPVSMQSFAALESKGLAKIYRHRTCALTQKGKFEIYRQSRPEECGVPAPKIRPNTSQPGPKSPGDDESESWNPPPPPHMSNEMTFPVYLTESEINFLTRLLTRTESMRDKSRIRRIQDKLESAG
jgi:hypothetical protein